MEFPMQWIVSSVAASGWISSVICFALNWSIFPPLQVQEMGCSHWEDLQQNPEREVCLGDWHGWKGLWVLNTLNVLPFRNMPLIVEMVCSGCQMIPPCGYCRAVRTKLCWNCDHSLIIVLCIYIYIYELAVNIGK